MTSHPLLFRSQRVQALVAAAVLASVPLATSAADDADPIRFGARVDVPPLAYEDDDGQLRGYSIDLCEEVKKTFAELFPERRIEEGYVKLTVSSRQDMLRNGEVDTICGAFSVTESRLKDFDFSFLTFVGGAGVATLRHQGPLLPRPVKLPSDTTAKVAVLRDTTTRELVESLLGTSVTILPMDTHQEAFQALADSEVDYYFGDRAILQAMADRSGDADRFQVSGRFLSYEPYAMPFAKGENTDLRYATNKALAKLYRSKRIFGIYERHFNGEAPNEVLQSLYRLYAIPE